MLEGLKSIFVICELPEKDVDNVNGMKIINCKARLNQMVTLQGWHFMPWAKIICFFVIVTEYFANLEKVVGKAMSEEVQAGSNAAGAGAIPDKVAKLLGNVALS